MSTALQGIEARRRRLVLRAAAERAAFARAVAPWRVPLAAADLGVSALKFVRQHPLGVVSGGILFSLFGASRVGRWVRRGWIAWQLIDSLRLAAPLRQRGARPRQSD